MLTPPDLSDETIAARLRECYGIDSAAVSFLPLGADADSFVYRVVAAPGTPYFLKLRRGDFDECSVVVPALLHAGGNASVMAPIPTRTGRFWTNAHGFAWMLYPFFDGDNGFAVDLSPAQWSTLGASLRAVHDARLPHDLAERMPREAYAPQWRDAVVTYDRQVAAGGFADPIAAEFAAFWAAHRPEIRRIVERADHLAHLLQGRVVEFVVCHADIHGGNVMVGANDTLTIVDWDTLILAPRERDLMFFGGGNAHYRNGLAGERWFYEGYGAVTRDPVALSYYHYERIVADLAAYGDQLFGVQGSVADRREGLRQVCGQFGPDGVVGIAHRVYQSTTNDQRPMTNADE